MDDLGIDLQVIYLTIFIFRCRAGRSRSRDLPELRWMAKVVRITSTDSVMKRHFWHGQGERRVKFERHRACGVVMRGLEADRILSDPYFFRSTKASFVRFAGLRTLGQRQRDRL
jgi:hypothetical protein